MNKADLIEAVARVTKTKKEANAAVDCMIDTITKSLKKKEDVTLIGFGTFTVK
jgi:DNA-binding protein HU-beta